MAEVRTGKRPPVRTHATNVGAVSVAPLPQRPMSSPEDWEFCVKIFGMLGQRIENIEHVREILAELKEYTGLEAVGIRLRSGEDYPYYTTIGFPDHFISLENFLCSLDTYGKVVRDFAGIPVLQCMCGGIIRGRFDSSQASFTRTGSFWTNDATGFIPPDSGRHGKYRNL